MSKDEDYQNQQLLTHIIEDKLSAAMLRVTITYPFEYSFEANLEDSMMRLMSDIVTYQKIEYKMEVINIEELYESKG